MKATVSSSSICSALRSRIGAIFVLSETITYFVWLKCSIIEPIFALSVTIIYFMRLKRILVGIIFVLSETVIHLIMWLKSSLIRPIFVMSETIINLWNREKNAGSSNSAYDRYHLQFSLRLKQCGGSVAGLFDGWSQSWHLRSFNQCFGSA